MGEGILLKLVGSIGNLLSPKVIDDAISLGEKSDIKHIEPANLYTYCL